MGSWSALVRDARTPWHVLAVASIAQIGLSVVEQGLPTLTGFVKEDLELSAAAAGLVPSAFIVGLSLGSYAAGVAADQLGERLVLLVGGIGMGLLICAAAAAPFAILLILLAIAGAASAGGTPAGGRMIMAAFPAERRGLAMGLRQAAIPVGGALGAAMLPWTAHLWGWRWSLVPAGVTAIAAAVPLIVWRPNLSDAKRQDRASAGIDRNIRLLTLWGCLFVSGQYALLVFLALDFHERFGLGLAAASLFVVLAQAAGAVGRVTWGAASDRALGRGRKPILLVLTLIGVVGALCLLALPRSTPSFVLVAVVIVAGVGCIGFQGLLITMVAEAAGPTRVGAAAGFTTTFLLLAAVVSPPLYGLAADLTGTYRSVWLAVAIVFLLGFAPAILIHERTPSHGQ